MRGRVNEALAAWANERQALGYELIVWSARGAKHSARAAELAGIDGAVCISKPGYVVDDKGWSWIRDTTVLHRLSALPDR